MEHRSSLKIQYRGENKVAKDLLCDRQQSLLILAWHQLSYSTIRTQVELKTSFFFLSQQCQLFWEWLKSQDLDKSFDKLLYLPFSKREIGWTTLVSFFRGKKWGKNSILVYRVKHEGIQHHQLKSDYCYLCEEKRKSWHTCYQKRATISYNWCSVCSGIDNWRNIR